MNDFTTHCIYRIVCFPAGKMYVGQTNDYSKRKSTHLSHLKHNTHSNKHLQNAYNLHGDQSFYFELLESALSPDKVNEREIYWIAYFNSQNDGYNITSGGDRSQAFSTPCQWNGVWYSSHTQCAKELGISRYALEFRLKSGHKCDSDLKQKRPVVWNGVEYESETACAKANGIKRSTMQRRIGKGYVCDSDILPRGGYRSNPCSWNGVQYPSLEACASANGLSIAGMYHRLRNGYTCDSDLKRR